MSMLGVLVERARSRLWPLPTLAAVLAVIAAVALSTVRPAGDWWVGDGPGARGLLQVLAGSSLTVVALVFSLHVVALQLAASQYSPRLLRTYTRDRVLQGALCVLIGTFAFSLVTLALFGSDANPPGPSVTVAVVLGLACVGALVGVVSHIVTSLRVETMMAGLHGDARRVIDEWVAHPRAGIERPDGAASQPDAVLVADRAGFVQVIDVDRLVRWAEANESTVRVDVVPGEHVLVGHHLARVWGVSQTIVDDSQCGVSIRIGFERTPDQDPALGLVQLVDIALRALSPSLNDPTTARHALGHLAGLLVEVAQEPDGADMVTSSPEGTPRVWRASRSLSDFLDVTCRPIAREGRADPDVLVSLSQLLAAVGKRAGPAGAGAVAVQVAHLDRCAARGLEDPDDVRRVHAALESARRSADVG